MLSWLKGQGDFCKDFIGLINAFGENEHKKEYKFFITKILDILLKRFDFYKKNGKKLLNELYPKVNATSTFGGSGHDMSDDENMGMGITTVVVEEEQDFGYLGGTSGINDFLKRLSSTEQ
jgi:hypothetical protein